MKKHFLRYTIVVLPYLQVCFLQFSYLQPNYIKWKIPEINNSYVLNGTLFFLSSVMKSHVVLLHPTQDMNRPLIQCLHVLPTC